MKSAIVIGASGFLGQHVLRALKAHGYMVYAVVHRRPVDADDALLIEGGINSINSKLIDQVKPELIFHCARPSFPKLRRFGRKISASAAYRYNKRLIRNLQGSVEKPLLIFSSGSLLYGNSGNPHPENAPLEPISYARQYHRGEIPMAALAASGDYPVCLFRLPWLLGPASWFKWFYLDPAKQKKAIPTFGGMDNLMEIIDIRDAVSIMLHYARTGATGIINIPGSSTIKQGEFAAQVSETFEVPVKNYEELFPGGLEKEAIEAFTSNITLSSKHLEKIRNFSFTPIATTLQNIKSGNW